MKEHLPDLTSNTLVAMACQTLYCSCSSWSKDKYTSWITTKCLCTNLWSCFKYTELLIEILIQFKNSGYITTPATHLRMNKEFDSHINEKRKIVEVTKLPVTIIRSRPDRNYLVIEHPFITFHYQLMGTTYIIYVIWVVKRSNNTATKEETSTTGTQTPAVDNIFRIWP